MTDTIWLRDLTGPHKGKLREYLRHAGENAIMSGFAEWPEDEAAEEPRPGNAPDIDAGDESPEDEQEPEGPPADDGGGLPEDFPARDVLDVAGFSSVESVPRTTEALVALPGIGRATAKKILAALEG